MAEALTRETKTPPRDDLVRMVPLALARAAAADDGNTLVGYATVFEQWAEIDSWWEGRFRERFIRTAFDKTLTERRDQIKALFNHGFDPQIGDKPLGKPRTMAPDEFGLLTETPLDDTSYNRDLKVLLASGALDGMSIRFSVVKEEWNSDTDDEIPERTITEAKLYEFGPVTFPAYQATTAGIRSAAAYQVWRGKAAADVTVEGAEGTLDLGVAATSEAADDTPAARARARSRELELLQVAGAYERK